MPLELTDREQRVCYLITERRSDGAIAQILGVPVPAVKSTIQAMLEKVGASDRYKLVRMHRRANSRSIPARPKALNGLLTPRQQRIRDMIAQGRTNAEIAESLAVSVSRVKQLVAKIFNRIGASNRCELVWMTAAE